MNLTQLLKRHQCMQDAGAFQWGYQCETSSRTGRQPTLRLLQGEKVKIPDNRHNNTLPCESCRRFLRPYTFKDEPLSRRQQTSIPVQEACADMAQLPVLDNKSMLSPVQNLGFGSQPLITSLMSMVISWISTLIGTFSQQTRRQLNLTSLRREITDLSISPNHPRTFGWTFQDYFYPIRRKWSLLGNHIRGRISHRSSLYPINERPDRSLVCLSLSPELNPLLRTFYTFDPLNHFNANLLSFQKFGNDTSTSTIFVETPHRVTTVLAENLVTKPDNNEPLLSEMEPYKEKMFGLFERFVSTFYLVCHPETEISMSPSFKTAVYGLSLPWWILHYHGHSLAQKE